MNRSTRLLASLATVTAALAVTVGAGLLGSPAEAAAASRALPADSAAQGYVGLCNEAGQNVTGGSVDTRPFIWKAVASTPPPSAYQGHGQNAVLGIFQPRKQTLPIEWGGTSLTAASYYRQRATPAAQATYTDQSLRSVITRYPPKVDGLYVLRMYFGRAGYGTYTASYPATTIQVTGSTWRVVAGGTVNCHHASAVSNEALTGVAGAKSTTPRKPSASERTVQTARSRVITAPTREQVSSGVLHAGGVRPATGASGPATSAPAASGDRTTLTSTQAADTSHTSSLSWVVWLLVGIVVLLVLALGASMRTRRNPSLLSTSTDKDRTRP